MLEDDLIKKPLEYNNRMLKVPEDSGWGIELDEDALHKYATGETIVLKKK